MCVFVFVGKLYFFRFLSVLVEHESQHFHRRGWETERSYVITVCMHVGQPLVHLHNNEALYSIVLHSTCTAKVQISIPLSVFTTECSK